MNLPAQVTEVRLGINGWSQALAAKVKRTFGINFSSAPLPVASAERRFPLPWTTASARRPGLAPRPGTPTLHFQL